MINLKITIIFLLLCISIKILNGNILYYREYYLSELCSNLDGEELHLGDTDADTVLVLRSYSLMEKCSLINNCTIKLVAPKKHGLHALPTHVAVQHAIGSIQLSAGPNFPPVYKWGNGIWVPSLPNNVNFTSNQHTTPIYGRIQPRSVAVIEKDPNESTTLWLRFTSAHASATWRSINLELIITAFIPLDNQTFKCPQRWYMDCGNQRCVRVALRCDGHDNCGNMTDELNCGMEMSELVALITFLMLVILFLIIVGYLYIDLQRKQNKQNPKIIIDYCDEQKDGP